MERTRRFAVTALGAVTLSTVLGVPQHPRVTEPIRSEEHTSELQSPCNLVCRLLLGKKKHTSELQSPCNLVCGLLLEKKKIWCVKCHRRIVAAIAVGWRGCVWLEVLQASRYAGERRA